MPTKAQTTIAANVRHYRRAAKLSIAKAAVAAGIHAAVWQRIESDKANPTLSTLEAVAFTLGTSIIHLLISNPPNE